MFADDIKIRGESSMVVAVQQNLCIAAVVIKALAKIIIEPGAI